MPYGATDSTPARASSIVSLAKNSKRVVVRPNDIARLHRRYVNGSATAIVVKIGDHHEAAGLRLGDEREPLTIR